MNVAVCSCSLDDYWLLKWELNEASPLWKLQNLKYLFYNAWNHVLVALAITKLQHFK